MRSLLCALCLVCTLVLTGCYRVVSPTNPNEAVAIEVRMSDGNMVREKLYLTQTVSREIQDNLGWTVSPHGSALLTVIITGDEQNPSATGDLDIPERWNMRIEAQVEFTSRISGTIGTTVSGQGSVSNFSDEGEGLETAARHIAENIRAWLEIKSRNWQQ